MESQATTVGLMQLEPNKESGRADGISLGGRENILGVAEVGVY